MATVTPTLPESAIGDGSVKVFNWALTTANNDGAPVRLPEWADLTWLASGTWGGATLKFQGSADGTNFVTTGLSNAAGGTEASVSADKVVTTIERPLFVRPILTTAGSGATVTVQLCARRANPMRT